MLTVSLLACLPVVLPGGNLARLVLLAFAVVVEAIFPAWQHSEQSIKMNKMKEKIAQTELPCGFPALCQSIIRGSSSSAMLIPDTPNTTERGVCISLFLSIPVYCFP